MSGSIRPEQYQGLRVWPVIRFFLWLRPETTSDIKKRRIKKNIGSFSYLKDWWRHQKENRKLEKYIRDEVSQCDVLFISWKIDATEFFNENYHNKHIDPIISLVEKNFSFLKIEILLSGVAENEPRKVDPQYVNSHWCHTNNRLLTRYKNRNNYFVENYLKYQKLMSNDNSLAYLEEGVIIDQVQLILIYKEFCIKFLQKIRPKAVFLVCYYSWENLGLIFAAKQLGIATVDVQHGKQGDIHGMYSHWAHLPKEGYELLPDYFWNWGGSLKIILKSGSLLIIQNTGQLLVVICGFQTG